MTKRFYIEKIANKEYIWTFFLLGTAFTLPFKLNSNNLFILGFFISSLFFIKHQSNLKKKFVQPYFIFVCLWCFWSLFSLFWTEDLTQGLRVVNRMLIYFVLSISFALTASMLTKEKVQSVFKYFIFGCFFTVSVCILNAIFRTYDFASVNPFAQINGNFFSYIQLTDFLRIHPIYLAFQLLIALSLLLYHLLYQPLLSFSKACTTFFIFYFLVVLMLLNSFIMFFNLLLLALLFFIVVKSMKIRLVMLVLIAVPVITSSGFLTEKFKAINVKENLTQTDFSGSEFTALNARVAKAHGTIQVINKHFWFGVGIGDAQNELMVSYENIGFLHGVDREFNSHNQYLTEMLKIGFVGFVLFLFVLVRQWKEALLRRDVLQFIFIMTASVFFLTESVLERQMGVAFFAFFTFLFSFKKDKI